MVKKIEKTYSVENGQVKKAVTFSTEEPISSQSSVSYSSNTPVGYGWFEDFLGDTLPKWARANSPEYRHDLVGDKSSYTKVGYDGIYGGSYPHDFIA